MRMIFMIATAIYLLGGVGVFAMHTQMPVTFGLALLRSVAWPVWVVLGIPAGSPLPMD